MIRPRWERRLRWGIALLFAVIGVISSSAAAHQLESSNGVSAVLHIVPDDNPRAGEPTTLNYSFTSDRPGFDVRYCACKVSFMESENRLASTSIRSIGNTAMSGTATVTFPKAGVYDLAVQGYTSDELRERFRLTYRVRVGASASGQSGDVLSVQSLQILLLSATSLTLLGMVAAHVVRSGNRYS